MCTAQVRRAEVIMSERGNIRLKTLFFGLTSYSSVQLTGTIDVTQSAGWQLLMQIKLSIAINVTKCFGEKFNFLDFHPMVQATEYCAKQKRGGINTTADF